MRREYKQSELDEHSVDANPFVQFEKWFVEAQKCTSFRAKQYALSDK